MPDPRPSFAKHKETAKELFLEKDLGVFEGNFESKVTQAIDWMNEKIKLERWTNNNEIAEKFAQRSPDKILADGSIFYMNPCTDLTLVGYALLKKNGLKPTLVAETLRNDNYGGIISMHFALEFKDEKDEQYFLEFVTMNQALLKKGEYKNQKEKVTTLKIEKTKEEVQFNENMEEILKREKFNAIDDTTFQGVIKQLQNSNIDAVEEDYKKRLKLLPGDGKLYLNKELD